MKNVTEAMRTAAKKHVAAYEERNAMKITEYDLVRFTYRGEHFAVADNGNDELQIYRREEDSNNFYPFGNPFEK